MRQVAEHDATTGLGIDTDDFRRPRLDPGSIDPGTTGQIPAGAVYPGGCRQGRRRRRCHPPLGHSGSGDLQRYDTVAEVDRVVEILVGEGSADNAGVDDGRRRGAVELLQLRPFDEITTERATVPPLRRDTRQGLGHPPSLPDRSIVGEIGVDSVANEVLGDAGLLYQVIHASTKRMQGNNPVLVLHVLYAGSMPTRVSWL